MKIYRVKYDDVIAVVIAESSERAMSLVIGEDDETTDIEYAKYTDLGIAHDDQEERIVLIRQM